MIQFEFLIFLGLGLLLAVVELISVRRAIRRDREAKAGSGGGLDEAGGRRHRVGRSR